MSSPVPWRGLKAEPPADFHSVALAVILVILGLCYLLAGLLAGLSFPTSQTSKTVILPSGAKVSINVDPQSRRVGANGHTC